MPIPDVRTRVASIVCFLSFAGVGQAADLVQAYRLAQERDPVFAAARTTLAAVQEKVPQARAGLLPTLGAAANAGWNDNRQLRPSPQVDRYNNNGYSVSLNQPLLRWQNWVGYDQSKLVVAQAEIKFGQAEQDLILRVAQAYFDVLSAAENLAAARFARESIKERLEAARTSVEIGVGTRTDLRDAEARHELARAQEIAADADLRVRRRALAAIVGEPLPALAGVRAGTRLELPQPADVDRWVENAQANNLVVRQQQLALEIASREVDKQRAGHYPTLDLVASAGRTNGWDTDVDKPQDTNFSNVGVQLNLPIFQGGLVASREREASALRGTAQSDVETARRAAELTVFQQYLGVTSGYAQVESYIAAVKAAEQAKGLTREAFLLGERPLIDVLNAENQLYLARRDLARAANDAIMARLRLQGGVGELGEPDVQAVNAILDPASLR
jgi:outer membrane protein